MRTHRPTLRSRPSRRGLLSTALVGAAAIGGIVAPVAQASPEPGFSLTQLTATLNYSCVLPLVASQPFEVVVDLYNVGSHDGRGSAVRLYAEAEIKSGVAFANALGTFGAASVEGTAQLGLLAHRSVRPVLSPIPTPIGPVTPMPTPMSTPPAGGSVQIVPISLSIPSTELTGGAPTVLKGSGTSASFSFPTTNTSGPYFAVGTFGLSLQLRSSAGGPVPVPPIPYPATCDLVPEQDTQLNNGSTLPDTTPPTVPGATGAQSVTESGATITWGPSFDRREIDYYEIDIAGPTPRTIRVEAHPEWAFLPPQRIRTVTGLEPGEYLVKVRAFDTTGNRSVYGPIASFIVAGTLATPVPPEPTPVPPTPVPPTPTPVPPTPEPGICATPGTPLPILPTPYRFDIRGSAALKTLTRGSLPLSGLLDVKFQTGMNCLTADLTLAKTQANLVALGFLPITADVHIVPTEKVVGDHPKGQLRLNAKVRIKLPSVKLFGIQIGGGANCQTKQVSSITLKSTEAIFNFTTGGAVAGTFTISDLAGCGGLNGIISPLTAGKGNALLLNLVPKA